MKVTVSQYSTSGWKQLYDNPVELAWVGGWNKLFDKLNTIKLPQHPCDPPVFLFKLEGSTTKSESGNEDQLIKAVNQFLRKLYSHTFCISIAQFSGQCSPFGLMLALCCDYRVMETEPNTSVQHMKLPPHKYAYSHPIPTIWFDVVKTIIGQQKTSIIMLQDGNMNDDECKDLVDIRCGNTQDADQAVVDFANKVCHSYHGAKLKSEMRKELVDRWKPVDLEKSY